MRARDLSYISSCPNPLFSKACNTSNMVIDRWSWSRQTAFSTTAPSQDKHLCMLYPHTKLTTVLRRSIPFKKWLLSAGHGTGGREVPTYK